MTKRELNLRDKILSLLKDYTLSTREISQEIGATYPTTLKHLDILHASSLIENKVYGKTKVWSLKKFDPFTFDINQFFYLLCEKLWDQDQNYSFLEDILSSFYLRAIEKHEDSLKDLDETELIKRYLELETNLKWKEIEEYDVLDTENDGVKMKIYDCKYKFGFCANMKEENKEICCIVGKKFIILLNYFKKTSISLELLDFSIEPNICQIQLLK